MKKTQEVEQKEIKIPPIPIKFATITLKGTTPLLVNKFSEKCKTEINDKQMGKGQTKKAPRDPSAEYEGSIYYIDDNKHGIPLSGVKNCAVSACSFIDGVTKVTARGAFHIIDKLGNGLIEIKGSKPVMDERMVRVGTYGNKKPMVRYRARYDEWEVTFPVQYNANVITPEQLCNLYENAGFSIGLCEHRPEKNGSLGMFQVKRG